MNHSLDVLNLPTSATSGSENIFLNLNVYAIIINNYYTLVRTYCGFFITATSIVWLEIGVIFNLSFLKLLSKNKTQLFSCYDVRDSCTHVLLAGLWVLSVLPHTHALFSDLCPASRPDNISIESVLRVDRAHKKKVENNET